MLQGYDDILALANLQAVPPKWWDEHGVPRFADHHPKFSPDIYADEVVLLHITCQACERGFNVQMSWSRSGVIFDSAKARAKLIAWSGQELPIPTPEQLAKTSLAEQVKAGAIHYGDPPSHDGCAGETMNCWDLRVVEFWRRDNSMRDWARDAELERALPDEIDPERTTGVPHYHCPKCKKLVADYDGFGVLAHLPPMPDPCGYCTHPSAEVVDDKHSKCGLCSKVFETC